MLTYLLIWVVAILFGYWTAPAPFDQDRTWLWHAYHATAITCLLILIYVTWPTPELL